MNNLIEALSRGLLIFKNNILIFIIICLVSSILAVAIGPNLIENNITEQAFNQQLQNSSIPLIEGALFSYNDIIASLLWIFQASIISTALLIASYLVKYIIDKRLFNLTRWRDWKFFLYISAITLIEIDILQKIASGLKLNYQGDLLINFIITLICCLIIVIFSSIFLPPEKPPIVINIDKI